MISFVSRRGFLAALLWLTTGCRFGPRERSSTAPPDDALPPEASRALRSILPVPEHARLLGEAYLWELAPRPSAADLYAALGPLTEPDASAVLQARIAGDYAAGRMVSVSGWLLSETEARLAALAALKPRTAGGSQPSGTFF